MIIGIEAERANLEQKTGVEHYAQQLIIHLAQIDHQNQYILYLRSRPQAWFQTLPSNFKVKVIPFPIFWTQLRLSWELFFHPPDVLLIPASALPIVHPKNSIVTIHDLAWLYFPGAFTFFTRNFLRWSTRYAVRSARSVIAVSDATRQDLLKHYRLAPEKVVTIHHGYTLDPAPKISTGLDLPSRYVLFLSTLQPRKNLEGLLQAFRKLKQEMPELPQQLVVVGKPGWKYEKILEALNQNKDIVRYLNHVSESEKAAILERADALVVPSFYEGFGMQILEAFAAGVPVAASQISSLPEVANDAAVYFDPHQVSQIKNALQNILLDKSLADRLRQKGRQRLQEFSWEKCAAQTLKVLTSTHES